MPEGVKQKMNIDRFERIFGRYSFEEKGEVLQRLKAMYKIHANIMKGDLQQQIENIDSKISEIDNQIS